MLSQKSESETTLPTELLYYSLYTACRTWISIALEMCHDNQKDRARDIQRLISNSRALDILQTVWLPEICSIKTLGQELEELTMECVPTVNDERPDRELISQQLSAIQSQLRELIGKQPLQLAA